MDDGAKPRDLEDRTFLFAESVRGFVKRLPRTIGNTEDVRQLIRASGSVAANWIEADEALSKKDFLMRVKICRKETKESRLFFRLIDTGLTKNNGTDRDALASEARELTLIFSSIIFEERRFMSAFFSLGIESCLGFGLWDLELLSEA
jgi:four helix bundle protein